MAEAAYAPRRGTRVVLHLMEDAKSYTETTYTERATIERLVHAQTGQVPVPIAIVEKPVAEVAEITDGAALWANPKSSITPADNTEINRRIAGQLDEPALRTVPRRRPARLYVSCSSCPARGPFDLFDPDRKGRIKLYVKRVLHRRLRSGNPAALSALCAGSSTAPICRLTSRARRSRKARSSAPSAKARPAACSRKWSGSPTRSRTTLQKDLGAVRRRPPKRVCTKISSAAMELLALARFKTTAGGDGVAKPERVCPAGSSPIRPAIYYHAGDDIESG